MESTPLARGSQCGWPCNRRHNLTLMSSACGFTCCSSARRQRPDLSGRLGPAIRADLRQHGLFGVDRRGDLHARPRRSAATSSGGLADRRYRSRPDSLVRLYGVLELLIAGSSAPGRVARASASRRHRCAPVLLRDRFGGGRRSHSCHTCGARCIAVAAAGTYDGADGWDVDRVGSRASCDPICGVGGWRVAPLYGVNTAGAATGAFLTDFALVPAVGLMATQFVAVGLNLIAAAGAFGIARDVLCIAACAATTDHHDDGLRGRALGRSCAGIVGVRCARHGDGLVATSCACCSAASARSSRFFSR